MLVAAFVIAAVLAAAGAGVFVRPARPEPIPVRVRSGRRRRTD